MKTLDYDKDNDILFVHLGFLPDEEFKTNFIAGNVVLDLSDKDRVCGIEIMDALDFLADSNVTTDILCSLEDAELAVDTAGEEINVNLVLKSKKGNATAKISLPLEICV